MRSQRSHGTRPLPRPSAARHKLRKRKEGSAIARSEKIAEPYTRRMARWPRYRLRTWARAHSPGSLYRLISPGSKDCGRHEWFRHDEDTDLCLHCTVGEREHVPAKIDTTSELWQWLRKSAEERKSFVSENRQADDRRGRRGSPDCVGLIDVRNAYPSVGGGCVRTHRTHRINRHELRHAVGDPSPGSPRLPW